MTDEEMKARGMAKTIICGLFGGTRFIADNPEAQFMADGASNLLHFHLTEQCADILRVELAAFAASIQAEQGEWKRRYMQATVDGGHSFRSAIQRAESAEQQLAALRQQRANFNAPFVDDEHKLLDSLGIPGTEPDDMGGSVFLSLESRIKLLAQQLADARAERDDAQEDALNAGAARAQVEQVLYAAFKFDDKPHQLFSTIRGIAKGHEAEAEIGTLMDEAYNKIGDWKKADQARAQGMREAAEKALKDKEKI